MNWELDQESKTYLPIPEGEMLVLTYGEYSSFGLLGLFRTKAILQPEVLLKEFLEQDQFPKKGGEWKSVDDRFIAWMIKRGLIEEVKRFEWHLGDGYYSNWNKGMSVDHV